MGQQKQVSSAAMPSKCALPWFFRFIGPNGVVTGQMASDASKSAAL